jgi:tRNA pseudouridine(55) synthase
VNGLLIVDKPAGMTYHDVVARTRRIVNERSIGHLGTLDPMATGVLPLLLGRYTRLAQFFGRMEKAYTSVESGAQARRQSGVLGKRKACLTASWQPAKAMDPKGSTAAAAQSNKGSNA